MRRFQHLCLLAIVSANLAPGQIGTENPTAPGELVDVGGYRVHLYCTGEGDPTVIVVGGGFSVDWGLVQPKVASLTRICTYDPSGTAWSDPLPLGRTPNCSDRVAEIHEMLRRAPVRGPIVVVGFSIGGLYARLYASRYLGEVAGMVIVDHAFLGSDLPRPPPVTRRDSPSQTTHEDGVFSASEVDTLPTVVSQEGITLGIEDDRNFQRLPARYRDLHAWAMSQNPVRPNAETAAECTAEVEKQTMTPIYPLGQRPLIVIGTSYNSTAYQALQTGLLRLSHDSRYIVAAQSTHMVIVDAPETIVSAIDDVTASVRKHAPLQK